MDPRTITISSLHSEDTLSVSGMCYETYPCKHDVRVDGVQKCLGGVEIARLFQQRGLRVPDHFRQYMDRDMASEE